jgi:hypothetical protein
MASHLVRVVGITLLVGLCMIYPFLPGDYDALAAPLSTTVQLFAVAALLLVPVGIGWLVYEFWARAQRRRDPGYQYKGHYFAIAALIVASLLATAFSLIVFGGISRVIGILALALWGYALSRWLPRLKSMGVAYAGKINAAPLYLIVLPLSVLLLQLALAAPLTAFSRKHAIANSDEFIRDIEAYHDEYGSYPISLAAMWKDYYPDVAGVEKFNYSPSGESYNLFFEQPRFLLDNIGTREWVVYNPIDEQRMFSHTAWSLLLTPEELERSQGWYAVHDAGVPHWKYFWFD